MSDKFWDPYIETKSLTELKELQFKMLKKLVNYLYKNNRFYHEKQKCASIKPNDINNLMDIEKLPFLTKQDLREYYPFGLFYTSLDDVVEVHAFSGTTGKPVVGPYTNKDVEIWSEEIYSMLNLHVPVKALPPKTIIPSTEKAKRVIEI